MLLANTAHGLSMDQLISLFSGAPAAGILGLVALALYKWVPKWVDKILAQWADQVKEHKEEVKELTVTFKQEMKEERQQCAAHNAAMVSAVQDSNRRTSEGFEKIVKQIADHHEFTVRNQNK